MLSTTSDIENTMQGTRALGSTWRSSMRKGPKPSERAASTNSDERSTSARERASRA